MNNYQLGPNAKPVCFEFQRTINEVLETTCEGIDYERIDQANLGKYMYVIRSVWFRLSTFESEVPTGSF